MENYDKQKEIDELLKAFRTKVLADDMDITVLGNPTRVKTLDKYLASGFADISSIFLKIILACLKDFDNIPMSTP